jgi:hypothetical protein
VLTGGGDKPQYSVSSWMREIINEHTNGQHNTYEDLLQLEQQPARGKKGNFVWDV